MQKFLTPQAESAQTNTTRQQTEDQQTTWRDSAPDSSSPWSIWTRWTGLDWTGLTARPTKTKLLRCSPDGSSFHHRQTRPGPMMGSRARRQTTMIDHAKHKTLKQCATRQCCRQESRGEQPGQSTRQPGPGFAAARIRDDQHNALQTGQASVGHGRALFFFIAVFSPAETSPEDGGKNGAVVGP